MNRMFPLLLAVWFCLPPQTLRAAEIIPLAGPWRFALDRQDNGTTQAWFAQKLPDKIQLPGILEAQGYGDEISIHTPWVLSLYDHDWYLRSAYAADTNADRVKVPFLCQPPRHYVGAAWYQRDIEIPTDWEGKRVELFLERPHWKSTVWLDDQKIGSDISLCAPHDYELGIVARASRLRSSQENLEDTGGTPAPLEIAPGKHRLTIRVDNRMILPYRPDAHSVSDSLDEAWNGIVGKMELRATPRVWIEDAQLYPDSTNKSAHLILDVGNLSGKSGTGRLVIVCDSGNGIIRGRPDVRIPEMKVLLETNINWKQNGSTIATDISFGPDTKLWDEFHPNLETIEIHLNSDAGNDSRQLTFGLREIHTDGTQFILNGHPIDLRGTHFGGDFPLTGYPPTDVASWKKIIQTCKNYGLNHIRFHSWCPPEAAFAAADELGFYFQIEPGMWNSFSPGDAMEKQLYAETEAIIRAYGNHPSFLLLSASNEAHGRWQPVLTKWVKHYRAEDPRRLYTPDTGWAAINLPDEPLNGGADYLDVGRIGPHRVRGESGWFGRNFGDSITGINVPVIGHEVGQWCAYPDFDLIQKFTGFMRPGNFEIFRASAARHGLLADNKKFAWASGRFQLACYKEEIEANLRTPGLAGFQLLDLHDYTGQGTALVGLLDPFWGSKGYVTPDEFKEFCNTVVPLARLKQRVFTKTDNFEVPVEVANYGPAPLDVSTAGWQILNAANKVMAQGKFTVTNLPLGKNLPLGTIHADLATLPAPGAYSLRVVIGQKSHVRRGLVGVLPPFINDWNFWLYPAHVSDAVPKAVFVTSSWRDAETKLANGEKVLLTPRLADLSWWSPPLARVPIFWNALMGPTWSRMLGLWCDTNSPALAEFPTEPNCDWQWTDLIRNSRAVNLDSLPSQLTPIVSAIDDWNRNYKLGIIFEARVGAGKLLVCSADLNTQPGGPQLRRSLLDYIGGDRFQPATEISRAQFESLFFDNLVMHQLGAQAVADGKPAPQILDGDPNTFWSSADRRGRTSKPPHEFLVSFPQPVTMNGLVLMPRQNQRDHEGDIRQYKLESSDDGTNWQTVVSGQLPSTFNPQTITFKHPLTTTHLKLTAISGFGSDESASLAELAVIYAGPELHDSRDNLKYRHVRTASPDIDAGGD